MANQFVDEQRKIDQSTPAFVTSLLFNLFLAGLFFSCFYFISRRRIDLYYPKSLISKEKCPPPVDESLTGWFKQIYFTPPQHVIRRAGLDAYVFVRYLRSCAILFTIFSLIAIPILVPVTLINQDGLGGMQKFTIGNIHDKERLWAHAIIATLFIALAIAMMYLEMQNYLEWKFRYLNSEVCCERLKARTVLVTSVPEKYLTKGAEYDRNSLLHKLFAQYGEVELITRVHDLGNTEALTSKRDRIAEELEAALTKYAMTGIRPEKSSMLITDPKVIMNITSEVFSTEDSTADIIDDLTVQLVKASNALEEERQRILNLQESPNASTKKIKAAANHVIGTAAYMVGLKGEEVTIQGKYAVFVTYTKHGNAQMMAQAQLGKDLFGMRETWSDISPGDIIWRNIGISGMQRWQRQLISLLATTALILVWSFFGTLLL